MNTALRPLLTTSLLVALSSLLAACGTPAAKDFGGRWKPVNRFQDTTTEIPLVAPYTYYASPMDGTLKGMLSRWTADTGMKLSYRLRSDFTLYKATSQIHTSELRDAASQLSAMYRAQGVAVVVSGPELVVEELSSITAPPMTKPAAAQDAKPATQDTKAGAP